MKIIIILVLLAGCCPNKEELKRKEAELEEEFNQLTFEKCGDLLEGSQE